MLTALGEGSGAAAALVEAALRAAARRIAIELAPEESELTFDSLLARRAGKQAEYPYGRSLLHDDITAIVIELGPPGREPAAAHVPLKQQQQRATVPSSVRPSTRRERLLERYTSTTTRSNEEEEPSALATMYVTVTSVDKAANSVA
eukprot:COSAG05_NODE_1065_length_5983_cov_16.815602_5_plen_147_part_00